MTAGRGLLGEIEDDLLAGMPLADLLRKTIILGGRAGSVELREWASRELKGYDGVAAEDLPPARVIGAPILIDAVTGSAVVKGQILAFRDLPDFVREGLVEDKVWLRQGIGELEAWAKRDTPMYIGMPGAEIVGRFLDQASGNPYQRITSIYWAVMPDVIAGVVDKTRTALTELVGELIVVTPTDATPSSEQATHAVNVAVHGAKSRVTITASQGAGATARTDFSSDSDPEPTWWTRGRRIGAVIVGVATVVAAVAAVLVLI